MSERIGKYEIISQVGEGSTSSVFLAHDPFAQRDVAIKRIHQSVLRDPERGRLYRHLLLNEASLAGKLIHPHIVQIYDAVVEPEEGYVVMEYVAGVPSSATPVRIRCCRIPHLLRSSSSAPGPSIMPIARALPTVTSSRPTSCSWRRTRKTSSFRISAQRFSVPAKRPRSRGRLARLHVAATGSRGPAQPPDRHLFLWAL